MKKKLVILLSCIMILMFFTCCSKSIKTPGVNHGDTPGVTPNKKVELILLSNTSLSDSFFNPYNKAIADFEAANPGVTIKHEYGENGSYKALVKEKIMNNMNVDIFFTWVGSFSQPFVESGKVLPLDNYITDEYKSKIFSASLTKATYNKKLYGVTYCVSLSSLFYNKKIFEENGVKPPNTFDELISVCEKLVKNSITPFSISAKDAWLLAMTHDNLVLKSAGHDKVLSALTCNGQSYNSPEFIEGAAKFQQLVKMGAFNVRASELSSEEAMEEFIEGETAMFVSGDWVENYANIKNDEDFDVIPFPTIGKSASSTDIMGGSTDMLMVSKSTTHPELAAKACFELSKSISKYAYLDDFSLPTWKIDYVDSGLSQHKRKLAKFAEGATSFTTWFDNIMEYDDSSAYLDLLQQLYYCKITPEEFAEAMDKQLSNLN